MATAGPNYGGTNAGDTSVGTFSWFSMNNASADDAVYARVSTINATSYYMKLTNFGFSIPSGNTIDGITVDIERYKDGFSSTVKDSSLKLVKGGAISGTDKADTATTWPTSVGVVSYGGASDLWGLTLAYTDVNASTFGVAFSAVTTAPFNVNGYVDYVRITVTYSAAASGVSIPVAMQSYRQRRV